MKFEYITIQQVYKSFKPLGYVDLPDALVRFIHNYNVIGVRWSEPTTISASYFLRLLQNGAAEKVGKNDNGSIEMSNFYQPLLDHGALWKTKDGGVICTAMPYGDKKSIVENFRKMVEAFSYPETIRLQFLDDKYRFRSNGNHMIRISHNSYTDSNVNDLPEPEWEKIELYKKAVQHSASRQARTQTTTSYVRDRYVSEYAKQRAQGHCQLCGKPAPFVDREGKPYLETHHIVWLSEGGEDSITNTVALCPNCHRKMHILNSEDDVKNLLKKV